VGKAITLVKASRAGHWAIIVSPFLHQGCDRPKSGA
jgi:hypothetical protein